MLNHDVVLLGNRLRLVPYLEQHVPRYHKWMCDPELLEATCSEPLSLEEEYENQKSWLASNDKLTFIILAPLSAVLNRSAHDAAHREVADSFAKHNSNGVGTPSVTSPAPIIGSGTATPTTSQSPTSAFDGRSEAIDGALRDALSHAYVMIGDCNLFVPPNVDEDGVEIEVMIAEKRMRRYGFAKEALHLLMSYAVRALGHRHFVAKILAANEASKRLFTTSLGFTLFKEVKVFGEEHFRRLIVDGSNDEASSDAAAPGQADGPASPITSLPWELDGYAYRQGSMADDMVGINVLQEVPEGLLTLEPRSATDGGGVAQASSVVAPDAS